MSGRRVPGRPPPGQQLLGMWLLGRGRREGIDCFGGEPDAVLAALAPWIAVWLVAALLGLFTHRGTLAGLMGLSACLLLAPPVLTEALARLWRRRELWPRFAAASLWCEWLMMPVCALSMLVAVILAEAGLSPVAAGGLFLMLSASYRLWLYWFVARCGLRLGGGRAALLVAAQLLVLMALVVAGQALLPGLAGRLVPHVEVQDSATDLPGAADARPSPDERF